MTDDAPATPHHPTEKPMTETAVENDAPTTPTGLIQAKEVQVGDEVVLPDRVGRVGYVHHATGLSGPLTAYMHMHILALDTGQMLYGIIRGESERVQLAVIPDRYLPDDEEDGVGPTPDTDNDSCECGHAAFMHGDVVGDTGCRDERCPCEQLRTEVRRCPGCGTTWTADTDLCPECVVPPAEPARD